jgi:hypothetical protein
LILNQNMFVERVLPDLVLRKLSDLEMAEYRRPFLKSEDRLADFDVAAPDPDRGYTGRRRRHRGQLR